MASTSGISFSGLSSGLDTDSIVTALTQAETTRKTTLQDQQNTLKQRQAAYDTVKSQLSTVARAAGVLNTSATYNTVAATVGDDTVASLTTTSSSAAGAYDLVVTDLARANKISSAAQTDTSSALGKTGTAVLNGKSFKIEASDSLAAIAQKINGLNAGATASIVDGGTGHAYLTISAATTGVANEVSLTDVNGTSMTDLGLTKAGSTVRQTSGNAAIGFDFSSKDTSIASVLGATGMSASTITVGGASISVDPNTDTLESLATKINQAGTGVTATVETSTVNGTTNYHLKLDGGSSTPTMTDGGGALSALGLVRTNPANELVGAKDAAYTLDGVALTSPTNTITGAIPGSTLTLKKVASTNLSLTRDTSGITTNVQNLVSSVNSLISTVNQFSTFDASTYTTGVLFGDSLASQAKEQVRSLLFTDATGVTGSLKNLASVGLGLDTDGNVTFDSAKFQSALDSNPDGVSALLRSVGTGSNTNLKYVSATTAVKASSAGAPYDVNITQVATQANYVAGTAQTGPRTQAETLTFRGSAFGTSGISIDFEAGTDLSTTIAKINGDSRLKDLVVASNDNGKLRIDAKRYGASGNFTLASNYEASGTNSGVGVGGGGTTTQGLDVMGTINGEPATGSGQFLTGATGNAKTEGLQIQYTGSTTGDVGTIAYSRGAASRMGDLISSFTDNLKGLFTAADNSLQTQIDGLDKDMATIDDRIASKTDELKSRFSAMETAIASLKQQSSTISSMLGTDSSS